MALSGVTNLHTNTSVYYSRWRPGNTPCYLLQCPHSALYSTALQQLNWTKTHTISPTFQGNTKVTPRGVTWLFPSVTWLTVYSVGLVDIRQWTRYHQNSTKIAIRKLDDCRIILEFFKRKYNKYKNTYLKKWMALILYNRRFMKLVFLAVWKKLL